MAVTHRAAERLRSDGTGGSSDLCDHLTVQGSPNRADSRRPAQLRGPGPEWCSYWGHADCVAGRALVMLRAGCLSAVALGLPRGVRAKSRSGSLRHDPDIEPQDRSAHAKPHRHKLLAGMILAEQRWRMRR